jgi:hypothetical protein
MSARRPFAISKIVSVAFAVLVGTAVVAQMSTARISAPAANGSAATLATPSPAAGTSSAGDPSVPSAESVFENFKSPETESAPTF